MTTPVRWLSSLEDYYSWGSQTNSFAPKFANLAQSTKDAWRGYYEEELRRYLPKAEEVATHKATEPQAQGEDKLRETVATVLEGWTIPDAVRKMLETAYWSHPQASEPAKAVSDMGIPISQAELPPLSPHDHPESRTYMWSPLEMRAIQDYARKAVAAQKNRPTIEDERKTAEHEYSIAAHNYPEAPIGSRDWTLYWAGWLARSTAHGIKTQP